LRKPARIGIILISLAGLIVAAVILLLYARHRKPLVLRGAVTVQDSDARKELPISDVEIKVVDGFVSGATKTDSSGFFSIPLPAFVRHGHAIQFSFRHPDYEPLDKVDYVGDQLYVVHLKPLPRPAAKTSGPAIRVTNVRVRYAMKTMSSVNVGSAVKTFEVENKGNIPCKGQHPCSPDGKWKAAIGSTTLDAGLGNEFSNARVSCIAGPCPFTKIEHDDFSEGGQTITASARNWSDTATFLMEAEVFHPMVSEIVHESFPVIFGPSLNFTLPASAQGICLEADLDKETIIFPLGPELRLSWANCNARVNPDQTKVYRCRLNPGYQF
jgi:hypothetical protein